MTEIQKIKVKKVGLVVGNGDLPKLLIKECEEKGLEVYIAALKDIADKELEQHPNAKFFRIGSVGKILGFFKDNGVSNICFAGGLRRPSWTSLIPDGLGIVLLRKIKSREEIGDDTMFTIIINFIKKQGFDILGADEILPSLLPEEGAIGRHKPNSRDMRDIRIAANTAIQIGKMDIGQAAVVQSGNILAVEGIDGTDALIRRVKNLQDGGKGAVLAKMKKPHQTRKN